MKSNFYKNYAFFLFAASFMEILRGFVMTQGVAWGVNWITTGCMDKDHDVFITGIAVFATSIVFSVVVVNVSGILVDVKMIQLESHIRSGIIRNTLSGNFKDGKAFEKDDILYRYNNNVADIKNIFLGTMNFIGGFGKILGGYIAGLMISWQLTLILVGFGFLKIFADRWIMRPVVEMAERRNAAANKIFSNILQFLEGLLFFRLTANQDKIRKSFHQELERHKNIVVPANNIQVCMDAFSNLIELAVILSVIGIGAILYINQIILLGAYVSLISLYDFFVNPYKFVSSFIHMKRQFSVGCAKVFELLKTNEDSNQNHEHIELTGESFCLKMEDVRFAYEEGHPVLEHLSADFLSGQVAYITGSSGAGKSTLLKLIQGIAPLQSGRIFVETNTGKRIDAIGSSLVTYVSQTPFLFPGSIAENIALCEESDIDFDKIEYALEKTCCRSFVKKLPGESRYIIQDNSKNLSGGQKSRIALARAFYKPTPVILLDEVYASLDNAAIPEIERALQELCNLNCCILFVTHRREWIPKDARTLRLQERA